MLTPHKRLLALLIAPIAAANPSCMPALAESRHAAPQPVAIAAPAYADLVDLAEAAPLVLRAKVRTVVELPPSRAPGVPAGKARIYVEAVAENLLSGPAVVGSALRYLADVPRDGRGKAPKLTKQSVLLFARAVPNRPGDIQLIAPDAQLTWTAATEERVRGILHEIFALDAPRRITGVREAIYVPGNLTGEGETQLFLATKDGEPAAISVQHHAGLPVNWSVSFSEVLESAGLPPRHETLTWYRLACVLPASLPQGANVSATDADRAQAEADYRLVMAGLGPCGRTRG